MVGMLIITKTNRSAQKSLTKPKNMSSLSQVKYTVQTGAFKDASLRVRYSYLRSSDTYNNVSGRICRRSALAQPMNGVSFLDIPVKLF